MRQPNLFSAEGVRGSNVTRGSDANPPPRSPRRTGSQRVMRLLFTAEFLLAIMVRIFIGVIVFVIPWSPLWDNNHLLRELPHLAQFFSYGATRGVISGFGLLNLWVAVDDTLHRSQRHI